MLEGQVDKALQETLEAVELQPCRRFAQRFGETVGRIDQQAAQPRYVQVTHREGEAQLGQATDRLQRGKRQAGAIHIGFEHLLQMADGDFLPLQRQTVGL